MPKALSEVERLIDDGKRRRIETRRRRDAEGRIRNSKLRGRKEEVLIRKAGI